MSFWNKLARLGSRLQAGSQTFRSMASRIAMATQRLYSKSVPPPVVQQGYTMPQPVPPPIVLPPVMLPVSPPVPPPVLFPQQQQQQATSFSQAASPFAIQMSSALFGTVGNQAQAISGSQALSGMAGIARSFAGSTAQGAMAGAAAGPVGAAIGAVAGATNELVQLPKRIRDLGNAALESTRHLTQMNGIIATAYAQLDADRYRRNVAFARDTAGTTRSLTESQSRLEKALLPIQTDLANFGNRLVSATENILAAVIEWFNKNQWTLEVATFFNSGLALMRAINEILKKWDRKADKPEFPILSEVVFELANRNRNNPQRRNDPLKPAPDKKK